MEKIKLNITQKDIDRAYEAKKQFDSLPSQTCAVSQAAKRRKIGESSAFGAIYPEAYNNEWYWDGGQELSDYMYTFDRGKERVLPKSFVLTKVIKEG